MTSASKETMTAGDAPAFPACNEANNNGTMGMTLRDWFAGQALAGEMTGYNDTDAALYADAIAARCYEIADAMIAARSGGAA